MKALVEELVRTVEAAWARAHRDPAAFSAIAADALVRPDVGLNELLAWLAEDCAFPPQDLSSGFGEPPFTLHAGEGWGVQLLGWVNGRTTIHEHDFAGAFKVAMGSSIQRRYTFAGERGEPLAIGELALRDIVLLEQGAIEKIDAGPSLIHSVFHLDRPTLSLVVRTDALLPGPQYDYWAPHVALDPHHVDPRGDRQVQTLAMLLRSGAPWRSFASSILARASEHQRFRIVDLLIGMHGGALPIEIAGIEPILASIQRARWEHALSDKRDTLANEEHRFFLATLLCAPDRASVLGLTGARHADARGTVRRWIGEIVHGDDPEIAAICVAAADAMMDGGDPFAALAARGAEQRVGDLRAFVEQLSEGVLAPLFRGP